MDISLWSIYKGTEILARIRNTTEMRKKKLDIAIQVFLARVALFRLMPGV